MTDDVTLAQREHDQAARDVKAAIAAMEATVWDQPRAHRAWTPADEVAHVLLACDFGVRAANGTMIMQQRRPAWVSALTRHVLLPMLLNRAQFPTGGVSPQELDPLQRHTFRAHVATRESAIHALGHAAAEVQQSFLRALETAPERRIVHAYFGGLSLIMGWRLLSAHTRHHARMVHRDSPPHQLGPSARRHVPTEPR